MNWKRFFMEQLDKDTEKFADDSAFLKAGGVNPDTLRSFVFCKSIELYIKHSGRLL